MGSSLQTPAFMDYLSFTCTAPKNKAQEGRPDLSEAAFKLWPKQHFTDSTRYSVFTKRNLNFSKNIPQCTVISPEPIHRQHLKAADCNARVLKDIYSRMEIISGSVFQQQPRSLMIEQFYREFWRGNPLSKMQCQLLKHTCNFSPKPRYPHGAIWDMRQLLEAT